MSRSSLISYLGVVVVVVVALFFKSDIRDAYIEWSKPAVPSEQPRQSASPSSLPSKLPRATRSPQVAVTPVVTVSGSAINLAVPFSSQAPRGDWSLPWQEACEETSALLIDAFWRDATVSVDDAEAGILALVSWQQKNFGYFKHTTAAQTAQMIRAVYGYKRVDVLYDVSLEDIKAQVRAGRPLIVPMAGRLLGNPYYTQPGPVYHMLVVKGIAENGDIITNDVGTRHGRNMTYAPDVFLNAMHDAPTGGDEWPAGVDPGSYIESARRAIIVVYPQ